MNKPVTPRKPPAAKPAGQDGRTAKPRARGAGKKTADKTTPIPLKYRLLLWLVEVLALLVAAVSALMVVLGYSAHWFSGTRFFTSLLPFAVGIIALIVVTAGMLLAWWKLKQHAQSRALAQLMPLLSVCLAVLVGWFSMQPQFADARSHFRTLVGGKQEQAKVTLTHQVYAAYRRQNLGQLQRMFARAEAYRGIIGDAATAFDLDADLLLGVAAAESSFLPRDSKDGGQGLFQITKVPDNVVADAGLALSEHSLSLQKPKHNAYLAAATLRYYLTQMHDDLFLGLLAYNIGPANGGLKFIMQQYGATDFVTIQPYLQQLPRDYPIRVLSYALAFRIEQMQGKLLAYEEGNNAVLIQSLGIPGLPTDFYDFLLRGAF